MTPKKPITIVGKVELKYERSDEIGNAYGTPEPVGMKAADVRCGECGNQWTAHERQGPNRWEPGLGAYWVTCDCGNSNAIGRPE